MNEIKLGVLREIVKDTAPLANSISAPRLLRRLQLDEPLREAQAHLRAALRELEEEAIWDEVQRRDSASMKRLVGHLTVAEMELEALVETDAHGG